MIPSPSGRRCREAADEGLLALRSGHGGSFRNPSPLTLSPEYRGEGDRLRILPTGFRDRRRSSRTSTREEVSGREPFSRSPSPRKAGARAIVSDFVRSDNSASLADDNQDGDDNDEGGIGVGRCFWFFGRQEGPIPESEPNGTRLRTLYRRFWGFVHSIWAQFPCTFALNRVPFVPDTFFPPGLHHQAKPSFSNSSRSRSRFQTSAVRSPPALARYCPLGSKARAVTRLRCPGRRRGAAFGLLNDQMSI